MSEPTAREIAEQILASPINAAKSDTAMLARALIEAEESLEVALAYMGIGTEEPPDEVFKAFQRLHGLPEIGNPKRAALSPDKEGG